MFQLERIEEILQYINNNNRANIAELSKKFEVSDVTIRRDLDVLTERGAIIKTHGGAMSLQNKFSYDIPYLNKCRINTSAKKKIGKKAAELIKDNDIIIIDSGSTTVEVAKNISQKNVTVITHDINIAMEIAHLQNRMLNFIKLIVVGGMLEQGVYTLVGGTTTDFYKNVHVNKAFLGCDALDLDFGISDRSLQEVEIKKAIRQAAEEAILVADYSKLNKKVLYSLFSISELNKIVIESIDDTYQQAFREENIDIVIAN